MKSLPRFSVNNPILVNLFMIAILTGGVYCGLTMVREMFPESRPKRILISTQYPGATPSEVEKGITLKIEEKVKDIEGVEDILSTIHEGQSSILLELENSYDNIDRAVNDVKAAIDAIETKDFPEEARENRVAKYDPKWPVISVALFGFLNDRDLKELGEQLRDDLLQLPGITNVVISGTRKDEISVEVAPAKLIEFGLSFMDIANAIRLSNLDLPGGQLRTPGENVAVRTIGEEDHGEALLDIVIRSDSSGRVIRVQDVATIVDGFEDVDVLGRFNSRPAANVTVYKTADQDAIAIAKMVRALVAGKMKQPCNQSWFEHSIASLSGSHEKLIPQIHQLAESNPYPIGVQLEVHSDLSQYIEGRLDLLKRNGAWGLVLVTLSLLFFLHWRVAFWVMMGLLLALMGSLIAMRVFGQTLNMITMFGLIVVLGLLVDDAIIVSEHVYSYVEAGVEPCLAAIQGTEEVTWPVFCAIATTIVAFLPLMYIDGQIGDWIGVLPVIVCIALSVSLIEALMILPCHLAHGLRTPSTAASRHRGGRFDGVYSWLADVREKQTYFVNHRLRVLYERLLRSTANHRYVTMAGLTSILIVVLGIVGGGHVPFVFLQKIDSETIVAGLNMDIGKPIEATIQAASEIERRAFELPELKTMYTLVGAEVNSDGHKTPPQSHLGQVFMELVPASERTRTSDEIVQEMRSKTNDLRGVRKLKYFTIQGGPAGAAIHLDISGDRVEDLIVVSKEMEKKLASFEGVYDIMDDFDAGRREVQIELFDSASALGLTTDSLATQVRAAFYGFEARKVQRDHEDVRIMVRYPPEYRTRVYDIESMWISTPSGKLVPFTEVARLTESTGFATIKRKNHRRTVTITADVDTAITSSGQVVDEISASFPEWMDRYPGVTFSFGGQQLETSKSFASIKADFLIALLLIYAILAGLFKSYVQPLIVMAVIPFGMIGAVAGHYVMGYPLTILSVIGLVALTGIVVNDSLILVTFINRRIEKGDDIFEAVILGGKSRLRPILLTSVTTVLGIAPLLMERSFQAKFLIPMGLSISAGLIFATVLTLVAIPSLYLIVNDLHQLLRYFGIQRDDTRSTSMTEPVS